jgi:hypothetical protein
MNNLNWFQKLILREKERNKERERKNKKSWKKSSLRCNRSTLRIKLEGNLSCRMFICIATKICNYYHQQMFKDKNLNGPEMIAEAKKKT